MATAAGRALPPFPGRTGREDEAVEVSVVVFIFCSVLGLLAFLYTLHFRHRALVMGPERLRAALSRTVSGKEESDEEELREGLAELASRLRRAMASTCALFLACLIPCLILIACSKLPWLSLALSGTCVLLLAALLCLRLLQDVIRYLHAHLA